MILYLKELCYISQQVLSKIVATVIKIDQKNHKAPTYRLSDFFSFPTTTKSRD